VTQPAGPAALEVFRRFLKLGVTSFGGPVAHLGYFRREFVERAQWLGDAEFSEIVALCSVLPGPTSSQVGISLGALRAGAAGGLVAWLAFTAPSAILLTLAGLALARANALTATPLVHGALAGLSAAAAAVVLLAVASMAQALAKTAATRAIALLALVLALIVYHTVPALQWLPLAIGGVAGYLFLRDGVALPKSGLSLRGSRGAAIAAGVLLVAGLLLLPAFAHTSAAVSLFSTFFRAGSLVFGGGHVVLPFLEGLVHDGRLPANEFFAGYGLAQVMPGPLFTFASFVGAANRSPAHGVAGSLIATAGIFVPSFLLLAAAVPLWGRLRTAPRAASVLAGVNASVVGLLCAVFIDPIARTLLVSPVPIAIAVAAYAALAVAKLPAWLVVLSAGAAGAALSAVRLS
jgi:chromate transporter